MKRKVKANENGGITLIALVVTIIVLLILSGISIAMLTGNNEILNKAAEASSESKKGELIERVKLDILESQLNNLGNITNSDLRIILNNYFLGVPEQLPETPEELEAIELTSRDGDYKIKIGEIYNGTLSNSSGGETIEKGKKVTGKNAEWKDDTNEYPAIIPVGFCVVTDAGTIEEGLVISDVENDDMENTKHGNQFVWIPVNDYSNFHLIEGYYDGSLYSKVNNASSPTREAGDTLDVAGSPMAKNNTKGTKESVAMYNSVKVNHGFYIARFEAGIKGPTDNSNLETKTLADGTIKPLSQKGTSIWNSIDWGGTQSDVASDGLTGDDTAEGAVRVARSMYTKSATCGATSTLCYGVQWDAVMNFIDPNYVKEEGNLTSFVAKSGNKGNHTENIEKTGYYAEKNIYDLAGNVGEFTMENASGYSRLARGGGFGLDGDRFPATMRSEMMFASETYGFRVALYVE